MSKEKKRKNRKFGMEIYFSIATMIVTAFGIFLIIFINVITFGENAQPEPDMVLYFAFLFLGIIIIGLILPISIYFIRKIQCNKKNKDIYGFSCK